MGQKLSELVRSLPKHPDEFSQRLRLILAGQHLLADDQYLRAATAWDTCRRQIEAVARLQKPDPSLAPAMRVKLLDSACRDLAKAADQAMADDVLDGEFTWTQKRDTLLRIAQEQLGGLSLLVPGPWEHDELLKRIGVQFQQHRWPLEPLKRETAGKKEGPRRLVGPAEKSLATTSRWTIIWVMGLIVALTLGGSGWCSIRRRCSAAARATATSGPLAANGSRRRSPLPPAGAARDKIRRLVDSPTGRW